MVPPGGHQNRSVNLDSSHEQLSVLYPTGYLDAFSQFFSFLNFAGDEDENRLVGLRLAAPQVKMSDFAHNRNIDDNFFFTHFTFVHIGGIFAAPPSTLP